MKGIFTKNKIFIVLYSIVFCIAVPIIFCTNKIQLHQFFNQLVGSPFNSFFKYVTFIGDGVFVLSFVLVMLLYSMQKSITILLCYLASAGVTQGIKYAFFGDVNRPTLVFEQNHIALKVVEGVDLNIHHSFPSGHATAALSLFFCLSFFSKNNYLKIGCFIAALTVAFSRVYLSQHFFEDITVGSFIGVLFSWLVCAFLFETKFSKEFNRLQKPVWKLFL
ncbi:MAG TPA: phosphatase PAP2 family protein [Bacteroidia bacterium]|nr:phosphatase PAP2 family protein [Bacteroidia bacterium]